MTLTTPKNAIKGSRRRNVASAGSSTIGQNAAGIFFVGGDDGVAGLKLRGTGTLVCLQSWFRGSIPVGQSAIVTVFKNGIAAGNIVFQTTVAGAGADTRHNIENATPGAAAATWVDGDQLFVSIVTSATTGTLTSFGFVVEAETDD